LQFVIAPHFIPQSEGKKLTVNNRIGGIADISSLIVEDDGIISSLPLF